MTTHIIPFSADATVLIDFIQTDPEIITLTATHIAPVLVSTFVVAEVDGLTVTRCEDLGLSPIEPSPGMLAAAAAMQGSISFADGTCLVLARERMGCCWTNDKGIRKKCRENRIPVRWGFEVMVALVEVGALDPDRAVTVARGVGELNPTITPTIVQAFEKKLGQI